MEFKATLNNLRMSPRKVRLVADAVRRKPVSDAVTILENVNKKASVPVRKLIQSAVANAKNTEGVLPGNLIVEKIYVDGGPTLRRFRPRAFGRAFMIRKRTSRVTVVLSSVSAPTKKKVAAKKKSVKSKTDTSNASKTSPKKVTSTKKKTSSSTKTSK